jgi:hypothetical protein
MGEEVCIYIWQKNSVKIEINPGHLKEVLPKFWEVGLTRD